MAVGSKSSAEQLARDSLCYPQQWTLFSRGLLPRVESNQAVNSKASVKQRAREFGHGCGRVAGSAALAGDEQRTLASREVGANPCQSGGKDKTPGALTLGVVRSLVGRRKFRVWKELPRQDSNLRPSG